MVDWRGALLVSGAVFALGVVLFARGWVGGGDVKFLGAAALWAGPAQTLPLLEIMGLAGGVLAVGVLAWQAMRRWNDDGVLGAVIGMRIRDDSRIPYGVAIAAGALYVGVKILEQHAG